MTECQKSSISSVPQCTLAIVIFYSTFIYPGLCKFQEDRVRICQVRCACMHAESLQVCCNSATFWIAAHQAPLATGFSRQEYWSGLPAALRCGHSESRKREEQHRLFHNGISVDISLDKVSLLEKAEETGLALVLFC